MEINMLITVLNQVEEEIRELEAQLDQPYSLEACKSLARQAHEALAAAVSMAKLLHQQAETASESQLLASKSSPIGNSEKAFKEYGRREAFKKRKTMPRWTKQVRLCSGSSTMDDGYSWRKYGQKEILESKFPRSYYRCTHRDTHGCLATKQVQRCDEDSNIFEISFRGDHTCTAPEQRRIPTPPPAEERTTLPETESLKIVSDDLQPSSAFSFPSICGPGNDIGGLNFCSSSSEMAEILSGATSTASESLTGSLDFWLGDFDFDTEFLLDFS